MLNVTVYDPSKPDKLHDEAQVIIHVLDSNDHTPEFLRPRYLFTISEQSESDYVGTFLHKHLVPCTLE